MDNVIYAQDAEGKFYRTNIPIATDVGRTNFVIVTQAGLDWSGFRTLAECEEQFPELQDYTSQNERRRFRVVER